MKILFFVMLAWLSRGELLVNLTLSVGLWLDSLTRISIVNDNCIHENLFITKTHLPAIL